MSTAIEILIKRGIAQRRMEVMNGRLHIYLFSSLYRHTHMLLWECQILAETKRLADLARTEIDHILSGNKS